MIKIPNSIKIFYCDKNHILLIQGPLKEKLIKLKASMQKYFSFSDKFLSILNSDSKKELNKLLSFQNKVTKNKKMCLDRIL